MTGDKSKWKMFRKKEVTPIPAYPATSLKPVKGCPCGNNGPCKQKITPRGVTIHYPQKRRRFGKFPTSRGYIPPKPDNRYGNRLRMTRGIKKRFQKTIRKDFSFPKPFFFP